MRLTQLSKENTRAILLCALYAFILLFFLSPDSYLRDLYARNDSAWFFTCGKAWMNGMIPYVDFADSKGLLLWLIYGLGYLLNNHSYVGVFWISVLFYTVTLFCAYKLCRLYIDRSAAALVTSLLPLFLFLYLYHYEVRAEDFCYTFVMLSLYCTCRMLRDFRRLSLHEVFVLHFVVGGACIGILMIKWNLAVANVSLIAVMLLFALKAGKIWAGALGAVSGLIIVALPFVIYFALAGNFDDFIREYFFNTTSTIIDKKETTLHLITHGLIYGIRKPFLIILFGCVLFAWKDRHNAWLILCLFAFRIVLCSGRAYSYYYMILMPFAIFLLIAFVAIVTKWLHVGARTATLCCIIAAYVSITYNVRAINGRFASMADNRDNFYKMCYVMAQVHKPKMLYYHSMDQGMGIAVDALPACKYWSWQNGGLPEMKDEQEKTLQAGTPDFVFVVRTPWANQDYGNMCKYLENMGYMLYGMSSGEFAKSTVYIYGHPGLNMPPEDFHVSNWDVWLKRNIFEI